MKTKVCYVLAIAIATVSFASCCKKRTFCSNEKLTMVFTGFNRSEIRTLILKRYVKGDASRIKAIDSATFVNNAVATTLPGKPDTSYFDTYTLTAGSIDGVRAGNDWVVYFPSALYANQTITEITENDNRYVKVPCNDNNTKCSNSIKHFKVNTYYTEKQLYVKK